MTQRPEILGRVAALAEATRARLLLLLERRELSVSELCAVLQLPQSTVSRHLKWLADDGWVSALRDGASRRYILDPDRLDPAALALWQVVRGELARLASVAEDATRLKAVLVARRARSQAFFSEAAERWERLRRDLYGGGSELAALLGLFEPAWTVGDLGCGTGRVAGLVAPFVERVVGIDASREMLEAARRALESRPNVELREGELEALPLGDGELDVALLILVLHHVADPSLALAEAARCLKPGGRLVIVDMAPHDRRELQVRMGHVWLGFEPEQLELWSRAAGLEHLRLTPAPVEPDAKGPRLFVASARRPAVTDLSPSAQDPGTRVPVYS
jgi:SAM-dependent methyltransferase